MASVVCAVVIKRKRPEVPPPERDWTDTEVDMWWVVGKCWQHEPTMRPDIRLVKSYLEGLAANRGKKLSRSSPSPSGTEDISWQEIVSAGEMSKAQRWIQEQMISKDLSQKRFDESSKAKMSLIRGDAPVPSSKRPKVSVLAPIQLPTQTLDAERYPTPVSAAEYCVEKRRNPSTIERQSQMLRTRPKGREWTRARPPSPHPHYKPSSNTALLTPPDTPSLQAQEFMLPPLPPKPELPTILKCPLDLDKPKIYYPTARRATRQAHKSRLREVVVETDYEADVDH
ncbi:hypothetical protein MD484_g907, partial [Candolleomyces efflorescens]